MLALFFLLFLMPKLHCRSFILYESTNNLNGAATGWTVTGGNQNFCGYTGICQKGSTIFQKNLTSLPSHYKFEFELLFEGMEGFTGNTLNVYFDGVVQGQYIFPITTSNYISVAYPQNPTYSNGTALVQGYFLFGTQKSGFSELMNQNLCAGGKLEQVYALKVVAEHNSTTIALKLAFPTFAGSSNWKLNYYNYKVWSKGISSSCDYNCTICGTTCQYCGGSYFNQEDVCVTACAAGYKSLNGKCFVCHSSCLDCSDDDPDSCISCPTNYWLYNGACAAACPAVGYYANSTNRQCMPCDASCYTCNGQNSSNCTSCLNGKYFSYGYCLNACLANQFLNSTNKSCVNCYSTCQTCYGVMSTNCLSCYSPYYWDYYSCVNSCYSSQYINPSNSSCTNCDPSCLTCSGPYSDNCTSCVVGSSLSYGSCVNVCNSTQYYNATNVSCLNCDASCLSCVGPYSNNCTKCPVNQFYSYGVCVNSCNSSQYLYNSNNTCFMCDSSCQTCNGSSSYQCVTCPSGSLFSYGSCINSCYFNQYLNSINNYCLDCDPTCQTCNDQYSNNCTTCPAGMYFSYGSCVNTCNSTQYLNSSNYYCLNCDPTCQTCNGPSSYECLTCQPGTLFSYGSCLNSCNSNEYLNSTNNYCLHCDPTCQNCSGPYSYQCITCLPGSFYSYGSCIGSCNSSQYLNSTNNSCLNCNSTCLTCDGPHSQDCNSCPSGSFFSYGSCISQCYSDQYLNSTNNYCLKCNQTCQTCNGPYSNNCTACSNGMYFSFGSCINTCNSTQYLNSSNSSCLNCDFTCQTCKGPFPNNCTNCPVGSFFSYGSCINSCNSSQYFNSTNSSCINCDPTCQTCNGPSSNQCITCPSGLLFSYGSCITSCNSTQYLHSTNNSCINCDSSCLTCNGSNWNDCLTCPAGYLFSYGSCQISCHINQYMNISNNYCLNCDPTCQTCSGPNSNECLTCLSGKFFSYGSCINACSSNQYLNSTNNSCLNCDPTCQTCIGPTSINCTSCFLGKYLSYGSCINSCLWNQYLDFSSLSCFFCDTSCQTCNGPLLSSCTTCAVPLYFSNGYCVSSCSSNQFVNIFNQCESCDRTCQTCSGATSNDCTSCPQERYLYDGVCNLSCPDGFFANISNNSCFPCSNSCLTCFGNSSNNCTSCFSGQFILHSECFSICPINYYADNSSNTCNLCDSTCFECYGQLKNNCLSCIDPTIYILNNGYCLHENCLLNQYFDQNQLSCQNCSSNCKTCNGPNSNNCLDCYENYVMFEINECQIPTNVYFSAFALKNPTDFELKIMNESQLSSFSTYFDHCNSTTTFTISNFVNGLYNYSLQRINTTDFKLSLTFTDNIYADTSYLIITLNNSFDNTIKLINQTAKILLLPFQLCSDYATYYENQICYPKVLIDYTWMKGENFNDILLLFSQTNYNTSTLNPILVNAFKSNVFYIVKTSSSSLNFDYEFQVNADSVLIVFNFNDSQFVKQDFSLKMNETQLFTVKDSQKIYIVRKVLVFTILNDYFQPSQKNLMAKTQTVTNDGMTATSVLLYIAFGLNSKSTYAIKGILLTHLYYLSKFVNIMFPLNARMIFSNFSQNAYFIKREIYQISSIELLLYGLPQIFVSFDITIYIINEILNDYILIFLFWGLAILFLKFEKFKFRCQKIVIFLRTLFHWNLLISTCMSKYVVTAFYTLVCMRFGFYFSKLNTFLTLLFFCYIILLPLHLLKVILLMSTNPKITSPIPTTEERRKMLRSSNNMQETMTQPNFGLSPKKSKFYNNKSMDFTAPSSKKIIVWEKFGDHRNSTFKTIVKNNKLDESPSPEKITIKPYISKFNDVNKIIPWESMVDYNTPYLPVHKRSMDAPDSNDSLDSKPNLFKNDKKIQTNDSITSNSMIYNIPPNLSNSKQIIIKSSKIFICFHIFRSIYGYLYDIKDMHGYKVTYGVLIRDFKLDSHNQYQIFIDFTRFFLVSFTVVILYGYAFLQMTIISFINLIYLIHMVSSQPFKKKIDFSFSVFNELCLNSGFSAVFILSFLDLQEKTEIDLRINLGWVYVFSYIFLLVSLVFFSAFKVIHGLKTVWIKVFKKNKISP